MNYVSSHVAANAQPAPPGLFRCWHQIPKLTLLGIVLLVFAAAYGGIEFTRQAGRVAIIWPADAFMLAIILRAPPTRWVPYLMTAYLGNFLADWLTADPLGTALLLSGCNTLEISLAAVLLARTISLPPDLSRTPDFARFVAVCGVAAPASSAVAAGLTLSAVSGASFLSVFQTWFASDALGVLTITPLLLMIRTEEWVEITSLSRRQETGGILLMVAVASVIVFIQSYGALAFLVFPFLIFAAFRLRFVGAALAMAILAVISIPLTMMGYGPFAMMPDASMSERVLLLQGFLAITVFTILPIAAVLAGRRRLEKEALAAKIAAERANDAKSMFLTNMSHELRTPMTGIMGMCDLLLASQQTPEQRTITETLERSTRSFLEMLNDVLDLAKIEAGRMSLETRDFRFSELLRDVEEFFAPAIKQKGLRFTVQWEPTPLDVLKGDPQRVRQILFNLVGNALKFTERGGISITRRQSRRADGAVAIEISVRDTGVGIPAEVKDRLFRPFEQLDTSAARRMGGTGLGLNICKQLVEAMDGDIGVESTLEAGSTFSFRIHLPQGNPENIKPRFAITPARSGELLRDLKLKLLFAEDNPTTQFLVREVMAMWGQTLTIAENGRDVVTLAERERFDVILMDMQMPVMDGIEAVRAIRASKTHAALTPVIALTADAVPGSRQKYLAAGCNAVVTKPIEWDVLAGEIKALVEGSRPTVAAVESRVSIHERNRGAPAPVFDGTKIAELKDGLSPSLMQGLLASCIESMERYLTDIRQSVSDGDTRRVKRAAHDLKSVCAQFGAARASEIARMIEIELSDIAAVEGVVGDLEASVRAATMRVQEIKVGL